MSADTRQLEDAGLRDVHIPSGLRPYVAAMWSRRSYVWYVARSTLREKQMNSVLGNIWHLLNPLLQIAVYYVIFGVVLEVDRGVDNFITFLAIGTLAFTFCQRSTLSGAGSIVKNLGLIRAVEFPRAVLPFTSTLTETLSMLPSFLVIGVVAVVTGETPSPRWLLLIPVMGLLAIFNLGAALYAARATSVVRDVQQILPFVFRILLYASGVLFSAAEYAEGSYRWFFTLNPVYAFLTVARWTILGSDVSRSLLLSAGTWTVVLTVTGFLWFRAGEASYGRS
ncbi:MAG: teichoic acid transport system permease protein [Ilumatobacter sp.]|jgi:teichoic acid transport system permease protein|tara:strand:- start:978 stop:1820 length:843 start_codon:yes stop_codon:yes gene_type:complete